MWTWNPANLAQAMVPTRSGLSSPLIWHYSSEKMYRNAPAITATWESSRQKGAAEHGIRLEVVEHQEAR
jgi:hypothetical protein